jgi:hypothetical protein
VATPAPSCVGGSRHAGRWCGTGCAERRGPPSHQHSKPQTNFAIPLPRSGHLTTRPSFCAEAPV